MTERFEFEKEKVRLADLSQALFDKADQLGHAGFVEEVNALTRAAVKMQDAAVAMEILQNQMHASGETHV
jgi:hypothetical protein